MREAIGQILPLAIAAGISPIPIIGVVLMLVTPRARSNGPAFVVGWVVGLALVGVVGLIVANAAGASTTGSSADGTNTFQIVLGALLIVFALRQWRKRPKAGVEPPMPKWMDAVDHFTPVKSAGMGVVLSAVNPKNLLLALGAAATIASTDLSGADQAIAYLVFAAHREPGRGGAGGDLLHDGRPRPSRPRRPEGVARPQQRRDHGGAVPRHRRQGPRPGHRRLTRPRSAAVGATDVAHRPHDPLEQRARRREVEPHHLLAARRRTADRRSARRRRGRGTTGPGRRARARRSRARRGTSPPARCHRTPGRCSASRPPSASRFAAR